MSTRVMIHHSANSCGQCGQAVKTGAAFCTGCGARIPAARLTTAAESVAGSNRQEFERQLKLAWSCLKDVQDKVEDISKAKNVADRAVHDSTFRDVLAKAADQGRLHTEFNQALDVAWKSAETAEKIDAAGSAEIDGLEITPKIIFATVCSLRGDLMFALEKWDEAVDLYTRSLQFVPDDPAGYYNIGAAYSNKHDAARAIASFQKAIELDPTGHEGIEAAKASEKLRVGLIGRKAFTGSWKVVAVLCGLILLSLFMMGKMQGPSPILNLIVWSGSLMLYCWRKYK